MYWLCIIALYESRACLLAGFALLLSLDARTLATCRVFAAHLNGYLPVILDSAPALLSQQPAWIRSSSLSKNFCFSDFGAWPFQRGHKHTAFVYPMSSTFFTASKFFFLRRRSVKNGCKHTAFVYPMSSDFFVQNFCCNFPLSAC